MFQQMGGLDWQTSAMYLTFELFFCFRVFLGCFSRYCQFKYSNNPWKWKTEIRSSETEQGEWVGTLQLPVLTISVGITCTLKIVLQITIWRIFSFQNDFSKKNKKKSVSMVSEYMSQITILIEGASTLLCTYHYLSGSRTVSEFSQFTLGCIYFSYLWIRTLGTGKLPVEQVVRNNLSMQKKLQKDNKALLSVTYLFSLIPIFTFSRRQVAYIGQCFLENVNVLKDTEIITVI